MLLNISRMDCNIEKNDDCYRNRCEPLFLSIYFELLFWVSSWHRSLCLTKCAFHLFPFLGFYLLSSKFFGSSRLMVDKCLYFNFIKLVCLQAIFSYNDWQFLITFFQLFDGYLIYSNIPWFSWQAIFTMRQWDKVKV